MKSLYFAGYSCCLGVAYRLCRSRLQKWYDNYAKPLDIELLLGEKVVQNSHCQANAFSIMLVVMFTLTIAALELSVQGSKAKITLSKLLLSQQAIVLVGILISLQLLYTKRDVRDVALRRYRRLIARQVYNEDIYSDMKAALLGLQGYPPEISGSPDAPGLSRIENEKRRKARAYSQFVLQSGSKASNDLNAYYHCLFFVLITAALVAFTITIVNVQGGSDAFHTQQPLCNITRSEIDALNDPSAPLKHCRAPSVSWSPCPIAASMITPSPSPSPSPSATPSLMAAPSVTPSPSPPAPYIPPGEPTDVLRVLAPVFFEVSFIKGCFAIIAIFCLGLIKTMHDSFAAEIADINREYEKVTTGLLAMRSRGFWPNRFAAGPRSVGVARAQSSVARVRQQRK